MNPIDRSFTQHRSSGKKALMPYLTLGYPQLDSALQIVPELVRHGAGILELGVPFSDPLADGPVIQASSHQAIENGMTMALALEQVRALTQAIPAASMPPVVLMTYTNLLMNHGFASFARDAASAGMAGLIVPDMPLEESDELRTVLEQHGLYLIYMVTPNLPEARIAAIAARARGFIYMVSVMGITGERTALPDISGFAERLRRHTTLPLALGFGISTSEHVRQACAHVDGVIIGSALIRRLQEAASAAQQAGAFLRELQAGTQAQTGTATAHSAATLLPGAAHA